MEAIQGTSLLHVASLLFFFIGQKILRNARSTSIENYLGILSNGMADNNIAIMPPLKIPEEDHGGGLASGCSSTFFCHHT